MKKILSFALALMHCIILNAQTFTNVISISGTATTTWTAPSSGGPFIIRITAHGGDGGLGGDIEPTNGGLGATMTGFFIVQNEETIRAISGEKGEDGSRCGGGGAGSGAVNATAGTILIIAGGGSGAGDDDNGRGAGSVSSDGNGGKSCCTFLGGGGGGVNGPGDTGPDGGTGGGQVSLTGISPGGTGNNGGNGGSGMGGGGGGSRSGGGGGGQTGGGITGVPYSLPGGYCQVNLGNPGFSTPSPDNGYVTIDLVEGPMTPADMPSVSATKNPVCSGKSTALSIQGGNLHNAINWKWYRGSCGGDFIGTGTSITVTPSVTTDYFVRGEGCPTAPGECAKITVTVGDNIAPVASNCPQDITVYTDAVNTCSQTASWEEPTALDDCAGALTYFSRTHVPGSAFDVGTTPITYVFKDAAGNESKCTFNVTVEDKTPPVICPSDFSVCINAPLFALSAVSAPGGTYSGDGVSNGIFSAPSAGVGAHIITYSYGNGCSTKTCSFTITVNALPTVSCPGNFSVCINAPLFTLTGGSPSGGTYSGDGVSNGIFSAPSAGVGSHIITYSYGDGNGCTKICSFTIMVNALPTVSCPSDFSVCINAPLFTLTGGSPSGGTYSGDGVSNGIFSAPSAGVGSHIIIYSYGNNGCTKTCRFTITVNALPTVTCPSNSSACINAAPFALTGGRPSGGTYSGAGVSNGMFNPAAAGDGPHTVTYSYTNGNECTNTCSFTITVNSLPAVTFNSAGPFLTTHSPVDLSGLVSPAGGTFSGPGISGSIFNPADAGAGTHTVVYSFTGINECPASASRPITVIAAPGLTVSSITQNELNSGTSVFRFTVSLSAPAGTDGVTFDIKTQDNSATIAGNDYVEKILTGQHIAEGSSTYTFDVTVKGDIAVEPDETFFVKVTNVTGANVSVDQGTGTINNDDISCILTCPADITVNNAPGQCGAIVNYPGAAISGSCGTLTYSQASGTFFPVGTTPVSISSLATGQSCSFNVIVADNEKPTITAPSNVNVTVNNSLCSTTGINLGNPVTHDNCTVQDVSNNAPSVFTLGTTTVTWTVRDNHGNSATATQSVIVATSLSASLGTGTSNCSGGTLNVIATGGGGSYTYSLDGTIYQPGSTFNVAAGTYTATVKDAYGCTKKTNAVTVSPSSDITATASASPITCNGGSTTLTVVAGGGKTPYSYSLDGISFQTSNKCTRSAGPYTIMVKDANGCKTTTSGSISQPAVISISLDATAINCYGGTTTLTITASGGTPGYTYSLNGCAFQSKNTFSASATTCAVTVKDSKGCTALKSVNISQPAAISVTASATPILCNGGTSTVTVSATGGTPPYTSTGTFTKTAGTYTFNIKDSRNCSGSKAITISQPAILTASLSTKTNVLCNGGKTGSITVKAAGGTQPYSYKLNTASSYQSSSTFGALAAVIYSVTVKDNSGCTAVVTGVSITQPATALALTLSKKTDASCATATNGSLTVIASGGASPLKYSLNNGSYGTSGTFPSLRAGTYTVATMDANACTKSIPVVINGTGKCNTLSFWDDKISGAGITEGTLLKATVSPNPSEVEFTLTLSGNNNEPVDIRVTDMYGRPVHQARGSANQSYQFGQRFVAGMYIVEILQGKNVKTMKIIKGN